MAAQTAVSQGALAATNIIRDIKGQRLLEFSPIDYGYFVPMANWRSCGRLLGRDVTGPIATFLHYLISAYRACGMISKWGIMRHALVTSGLPSKGLLKPTQYLHWPPRAES